MSPNADVPKESMSFPERILAAINSAITLDISTVVESNAGEKSMKTKINMAAGDIETRISEEFVGDGPYSSLREFHQKREEQGHDIVKGNVDALLSLLGLFKQTENAAKPPA
jgi:hypothetical protein